MSLHDDFIKKAYKEIDKLTADIEKKKSRIVELRASIKKHETDRTRDSEFSDTILRLLSDNGIDTDEARASVLESFEECILAYHISKEEQSETPPSENSSEIIEPEISDDPVSDSNSNYTATAFSQNPVYPYKPTN